MKCDCIDLGISSYTDSVDFQNIILEKKLNALLENALIIVEHNPVITMGRKADKDNILLSEKELQDRGIQICSADRGGDVTYHGPGQIVAWPIFDLRTLGKDIHRYLRMLEETVILLLKDYDIKARTLKGLTGVWVDDDKISSIGIGVRKWVSYHGVSLNVNTCPEHLSVIHPCGLKSKRSTTMKELLNKDLDISSVKKSWVEKFRAVFDLEF